MILDFYNFSTFDKMVNSFMNEIKSLYELYESEKSNMLSAEEKEVSPPKERENKCACGENCTCTRTLNECEDYTSTVTEEVCNKPCVDYGMLENELLCENVADNCPTTVCDTVDGWWKTLDGDWKTDIYVPVDKQHTEVNILDGERVQVAYDQSHRVDEANMSGYSHMSGSFVFPIPKDVDLNTFKARRDGSYIELRVSPLKPVNECGSCFKVDIQD